jgi:hypothetical protein
MGNLLRESTPQSGPVRTSAIRNPEDRPPSALLPRVTIRFNTEEQKRSVKLVATSMDATIQDFTMLAYNCIYKTLGLEPLDPNCPIELPTKKRPKRGGT